MSYMVVLIPTDFHLSKGKIQTFGPYGTPELAEAARRRVHFDAQETVGCHQQFSDRAPRTYVTELERAR
jgi:hypothetical protein